MGTEELEGSARNEESFCPHCGQLHPSSWSHCPNTGKALTVGPALIGRTIAGRYRIERILGEGGMGAVYEAEHIAIGRRVALKRLHPELAVDARSVHRFQREARIAGSTGHDHIVDVLDLGFAEDGAPFLVMELLEGETLAARLAREGRLKVERAARVAGQALAALEMVHAKNVVHRDLKPDNIFLINRHGRTDFVKVLDFGVSKVANTPEITKLTKTGVMVGTPHYMSPEQARGMDVDHRVDIYAIGVVLYECLSGTLPFRGANYHALLQAILRGDVPRLTTRANVPQALADLVHSALDLDRERRPQDARMMREALVAFGADAPERERPESTPPPRIRDTLPRVADDSPHYTPLQATPKPMAAQPQHFVATSNDWRDVPMLEDAPAASTTHAKPSLPSAPTLESRPFRKPDATRVASPARKPSESATVKGAFVIAARRHLLKRYGEDDRPLTFLSAARREDLRVVLPISRVPLRAVLAWLDSVDRTYARGDGSALHALGRAVASTELARFEGRGIEWARVSLPAVWRSYFHESLISIDEHSIHIVEGTTRGTLLRVLAGFAERALEMASGQSVRASTNNEGVTLR